ncbi:aspartate aminotransferase family protein [Actinosynnema sp. ALI-1.44]|uniref:aminotransferase class III-fold pyridoxal phosphate-dependent enzyme n=1 Tax=Actinosynnema sp. ALI-1.44 TaxID=1933779 RepID=UPI00097C0F6A|nr:aminotransferase class III-fold pyridoxal phosphate-dependent enzyme [Actinosynnema sp. ALI-1.44]ONI78035.1 aspartate aminotransferase family protein [Actinosynnema sp. ALI-1.44]
MSRPVDKRVFADKVLNDWLSSVGLGIEYTRADGNTLYFVDENGDEVPVLDHVCGFGSLILGHNNREIVEHAKSVLDRQVPVYVQLSRQSHADDVAAELNAILRREIPDGDQHYSAIYANSGAEAVEICLKHAELERQARIAALADEVGTHIEQAREAFRAGNVTVADTPYVRVERNGGADEFESLVAEVERRNAELMAREPVHLALENAFHGKLVASIQLTQNPHWRTPFTALASSTRFVRADQPEAMKTAIEDVRESMLDVLVDDGVVTVAERDFPVIGAFFVEPVQGANGMRVLTEEAAREIRAVCDAVGCPLVVDEIHSGMGRTGAFFASKHMGLRGDYYTLSKSLGGGIAKNSVVLFRQDRFRPEFEVIHSSTYAKDGYSGAIAKKVLRMLEADNGKAYAVAAELGGKLKAVLESVRAEFPEVVDAVNGIGLMLALEFKDQTNASSELISEKARSGMLGYVIAGYILREHRIRVLPLGPSGNSVRFEPSIFLTDADIARTGAALRDACTILRDQAGHRLAR